MIYFDSASTTRVCDECVAAVSAALKNCYGNPSSLYSLGFEAEKELESARQTVAAALGCRPKELVFTASGSESNNMALFGAARARRNFGSEIVVTAFEHPSVAESVAALAKEGFTVIEIAPKNGVVDIEQMAAAVGPKTALVAAMGVNNETGARLDAAALAELVKQKNRRTAVHCDWVQGFLKHPLSVAGTKLDTVSVSAHKIHGPKGMGALYVRDGFNMQKYIYGGHQERGRRAGTENVAYAAGFAAALKYTAARTDAAKAAAVSNCIKSGLAAIDGVCVNSPPDASPFVVNFSLPGFRSETVLHFLEDRQIYVSSGSACSKGEPSRTLLAMGLPAWTVDGAVRVSLDCENTPAQAEEFVAAIKEARDTLAHK